MYSGTRSFIVIAFTFLACFGPGSHWSEAQQIRIESFFPRQLPLGQATVINVAVQSRDAIQAAEISPSPGVKVSGIKLGQNIQGALTWSELTIDVADDAAPGDRALVLLMPMGRTAPVTLMIPSHVPRISELHILSAQSNQPTLELQFDAVDGSADLGVSPYVWFMIGCDGESLVGVINGTVNARDNGNGIVHAIVPIPRLRTGGGTPAAGKCDFQVRVSDSGGIDSNTLKTTVDLKN